MIWPFSAGGKKGIQLGIDIGTSFIRAVALSQIGRPAERFRLENYGHIASDALSKKPGEPLEHAVKLDAKRITALLTKLLQAMGEPRAKRAVISLPVFSSFITEIELPTMSEKELSSAIGYQAEGYIPVPVSEVELDWQIIQQTKEGLRVLLAAVPKYVLRDFQQIARQTGLELAALEIETFALVRALDPGEPMWMLLDLGGHNTAIALVNEGYIRISRNIDTSGRSLTNAIAQSLDLGLARSESLKRRQGLLAQGGEQQIVQTMEPVLAKIIGEAERVISAAFQTFSQKPSKVVLTGGSSQLKGLPGYIQEKLRVPVERGYPWRKVEAPPILSEPLKELAPSFAVAVGAAMR